MNKGCDYQYVCRGSPGIVRRTSDCLRVILLWKDESYPSGYDEHNVQPGYKSQFDHYHPSPGFCGSHAPTGGSSGEACGGRFTSLLACLLRLNPTGQSKPRPHLVQIVHELGMMYTPRMLVAQATWASCHTSWSDFTAVAITRRFPGGGEFVRVSLEFAKIPDDQWFPRFCCRWCVVMLRVSCRCECLEGGCSRKGYLQTFLGLVGKRHVVSFSTPSHVFCPRRHGGLLRHNLFAALQDG